MRSPLARGHSTITAVIYGRDAERAHLADVVEAARVGMSTALVVRGEAGAGKSTLLDDLVEGAEGFRTLRALGVESDSELAFAGLLQLLTPLLGEMDALSAPRREALASALGLRESDAAPDRFLIATAVLDLLANASERGPLLAIVDDAHWLDGASQDALLFVARRLDAEGIALVFGARDGDVRGFEAPGVARLDLVGLDEPATLELIEHWSDAAPSSSVAHRLVAATGGNPLALTELAVTLDSAELGGTAPLPDPLPVARGVEAAFLERVRRLPEATRTMLLLAALEPERRSRSAGSHGRGRRRHGGRSRAGRGRRARAPVLDARARSTTRSCARRSRDGATFAQRRRAHLALAAALPPADAERRAWHAAAAASEPDEQLAADLEQLAKRARERAGNAAAQAALTRAADLTPEAGARGRRLVSAADAAWAGRSCRRGTGADRALLSVRRRARACARSPAAGLDHAADGLARRRSPALDGRRARRGGDRPPSRLSAGGRGRQGGRVLGQPGLADRRRRSGAQLPGAR